MTILTLFGLPPAVLIGLIASVFIPALSSLVVREHWDKFWAGIITLTLSTADGFFSTWAANTVTFHWKAAIGATFFSWIVALMSRIGLLKNTGVDDKLVAAGSGHPAIAPNP